MSKYQIAVVVGSLRLDSFNRKLSNAIVKLASLEFSFKQVQIGDSIPGILKNAIDHASRPYGQSAWAGKPAGVLGTSPSTSGTAMVQQHLRNIFAYLDMPTLGQPKAFIHIRDGLFDEAGDIGADSKKNLQNWMDHYVAWVKKHAI